MLFHYAIGETMARRYDSNQIVDYLVVAIGTFLGYTIGGFFRSHLLGAVIGSVIGLYFASRYIR